MSKCLISCTHPTLETCLAQISIRYFYNPNSEFLTIGERITSDNKRAKKIKYKALIDGKESPYFILEVEERAPYITVRLRDSEG
jgi:hypothetical protein